MNKYLSLSWDTRFKQWACVTVAGIIRRITTTGNRMRRSGSSGESKAAIRPLVHRTVRKNAMCVWMLWWDLQTRTGLKQNRADSRMASKKSPADGWVTSGDRTVVENRDVSERHVDPDIRTTAIRTGRLVPRTSLYSPV